MIRFFLLMLLPLGYCIAYIVHSIRNRHAAQAAAVAVLLLLLCAVLALLLWEFLTLPK